MLDHDAIAERHSALLTQMLGRECNSDAYRTFDGDEGEVLLIEDNGYHWVFYERGQENGRRPGTEAVHQIVGLGAAADLVKNLSAIAGVRVLRDRLESEILYKIPNSQIGRASCRERVSPRV